MKGFKDSTRTLSGHGHHPIHSQHHLAHGGMVPSHPDPVHGLHEKGGVKDMHPYGEDHSAVLRQVPSTEGEAEHGGKGPLNPGYNKGGKTQHFHVHKHYHSGGKVRTETKSYRKAEREAEHRATGGTINKKAHGGSCETGGTRDKLKKGGMHINPAHKGKFTKKMTGSKHGHLTGHDVQKGLHSKSGETRKEANFARMARRGFKPLAKGGHVIDSTHPVSPDYKTGGTINRRATGGTINKKGAGGALYKHGGETHHEKGPEHRGFRSELSNLRRKVG